jgi:hypothetical protein
VPLADIPNHQHPAFPQPADLNAVIWRYLGIEKFEWLVAERRLYMARADLLGDEHEGTTPPAELAGWRMAAEQAEDEHQRRTIESNRAQLSEYAEVFRQSYYVSCWQMAPDENVAMWDRYVKTPDSLAVKTSYSTLREQLQRMIVELGVVRYIDYDRQGLPSVNMLQLITHKRHFFADEREVRAVVCTMVQGDIRHEYIDPFLTTDGRGFTPSIDPQRLIQGIVLHPRASPEFSARVSELCVLNGLPAPGLSRLARKPVF